MCNIRRFVCTESCCYLQVKYICKWCTHTPCTCAHVHVGTHTHTAPFNTSIWLQDFQRCVYSHLSSVRPWPCPWVWKGTDSKGEEQNYQFPFGFWALLHGLQADKKRCVLSSRIGWLQHPNLSRNPSSGCSWLCRSVNPFKTQNQIIVVHSSSYIFMIFR